MRRDPGLHPVCWDLLCKGALHIAKPTSHAEMHLSTLVAPLLV